MRQYRASSYTKRERFNGKHRFEHWYRDNSVYFITSRTRDGYLAFLTPATHQIFWDRFDFYTTHHGFTPWVTSLIGNHYHTLGYLRKGEELGEMMRKFHGSVAKLVNDELGVRHRPFFRTTGHHDYFDGCIRNETQARRAYRYTLTQSIRHQLSVDWQTFPNTRVNVELEPALRRSLELDAFLEHIPYARYQR